MALLPDLAAAALYAVVVFLLFLGLLVVFVETIPPRLLMVMILATILFAAWLAWVGEIGLSFLALGAGAALAANPAFERLTNPSPGAPGPATTAAYFYTPRPIPLHT